MPVHCKGLLPLLLALALVLPSPLCAGALRCALLLEHEEPSAWTGLLREGLDRGARDFGADCRVIILPPGPEQRNGFRKAAEESDLVIVASDNLHEALRDNAANYRRVKFGSIDAGIRAPNIMSVTFADEQAAFLAGAAAAMLTKKAGLAGINGENTIGWLSGADTPAMRSLFNGYVEGAALADPATRVIQAVAGSFTDSQSAGARAARLLDAGADVIALAAGAGNEAARKAALARGAYVIELDRGAPGDRSLGIIAKAADRAVHEIIASAASGKFRGKEIVIYDLANGGVNWLEPGAFLEKSGAYTDIARRSKELRGEIEKGSIRTRSLRARTLCDCLD